MRNGRIKIRLSGNELEALTMGYQQAVKQMEHESRTEIYSLHETLLLEHATAMRDKLERLHERGQLKYTLSLSPVEAMAVYQLWQREFALTTYSGNAVRKVFGEIDERHRSALWVQV